MCEFCPGKRFKTHTCVTKTNQQVFCFPMKQATWDLKQTNKTPDPKVCNVKECRLYSTVNSTTPLKRILSKSYHEIIGVFIYWCNLLYKNKRVFHMAWHFIQSFTDPETKWKGPQNMAGVAFIFGRGLWNSVWHVMPCGKPFWFGVVNCINVGKPRWFHDKIWTRFFWRGL